ncbi:nitroreductase [Rhodococcus sp. NPDC003318]|uniref:nitroreductase n=1 Tax=Rhodococcus sp. NPDC003318 TaxID=3364503 RepID=UPI003676F28F
MTDTTVAPSTLAALLSSRFSCRAFLPDPVPEDVIVEILTMAQRTPSWCNTQPWQVAVTDSEATDRFRQGLAEAVRTVSQAPDIEFPGSYHGVYRDRRRECALQLYSSLGIAGDRQASAEQAMRNFDLFGAPHVAIVTTDAALGTYAAVDCGLYVNTFLLAAQSLGVATVPQAALAGCAPYVRDFFDIADDRNVLCAISFGYPDLADPANGFRTGRADLESVVTWVSN